MDRSAPAPGPLPDEWIRDHFDHLSPQLSATLPETMDRMRSLCPVAHSDQHGGFWVMSRYEDVVRTAQDWETYSSAHGLAIIPVNRPVRSLPVESDPPEQRVYKRLANPFFTPAAVAAWEQGTRDLVNSLFDEVVESGECDFMNAVARPMPSQAFFKFALNAPAEDVERVAYLASKSSVPNDPEAGACWAGLAAWTKEFVHSRRGHPRGDVVDALLAAQDEGELNEDELVGMVQLLILGGLETTAGALGLMFLRFCRQPEIPAQLMAQPELINTAVHELLRLDPPFVSVGRTCMRDVEVDGHQLHKGDKVLIHWASANRDAGEFDHPDEFDLHRDRNRHISFGLGPHRCIGSNLARMNLRVTLEELLPRMADLKLAEGADLHFHPGLTRAPLNLPVTFRPGPRTTPARTAG